MWIHPIARARGAGLILGLVSIVFLVGCGGDRKDPRKEAGAIVFTVNRSGFSEIWVMDSDGRNRTKLTASAQAETDAEGSTTPAWSSDGAFIAYSSSGEAVEENQRNIEIYVMRADGSEPRRLTNDRVFDAMPAWSPDGKRIAFTHIPALGDEDADGVLIVIGPDGRGRSQLTHHPDTAEVVFDLHPRWSPDGSLVAFTRATVTLEGKPRVAIHAIAATGTGERLLIEDAAEPAWSPDGSRIVFTSTRDRNGKTCFEECSPNGEIYEAQADGTGVHRLTRSQAQDQTPTWTSDGEHIAFVSDRSNRADHEYEIYVMSSDGSGLRRLTTNHVWDPEPAVRPG